MRTSGLWDTKTTGSHLRSMEKTVDTKIKYNPPILAHGRHRNPDNAV